MTTKTAAKIETATNDYNAASAAFNEAIAAKGLVSRAAWTLTQGSALTTLTEDMLIDLARVDVAEKAFYLGHEVLIEVARKVAAAKMDAADAALKVAIDALEAAEQAAEKAAARSAKRRAS